MSRGALLKFLKVVNAGESPNFYYYRDKDKNEIDLLIEREGKIYPVEFKKVAILSKADVSHFNKLSNFNMLLGTGALVSIPLSGRYLN